MAATTALKRILIDCSYINFGGQPSGIPRVVLAYVEVGYAWGRRNGIEVIPVVPTEQGLFLVRPVPGQGAPQALLQSAGQFTSSETSSGFLPQMIARVRRATAQWLVLTAFHLGFLAIALLNIRSVWPLERSLRRKLSVRYDLPDEEQIRDGSAGARIDVRPGDLLFCPAYWHDVEPRIYHDFKQRGGKVVILVHDVLPILFERFYQAPWRYLFRDNVRAAFGYADALFCVSSYTAAAVREFGMRERCRVVPVATAYNGFEPLADTAYIKEYAEGQTPQFFGNERLRAILARPKAPFLMVGSIEPKKGHIPVIRCFEAMWRGGFERDLFIIGRRAWMSDGIAEVIENSPYFGRKLFWLYDIIDFDLAYAYVKAHALVFSSIGEGFGIPMIEASFYGKPTVVLDTPIAREVLGDVGLYYRDAHGFVDQICRLEDTSHYTQRCERARDQKWPSWSEYAPKVFEALRRVHEGGEIPAVVPRTQTPEPVMPHAQAA